jgi:hypothetical protein
MRNKVLIQVLHFELVLNFFAIWQKLIKGSSSRRRKGQIQILSQDGVEWISNKKEVGPSKKAE